MDQKLLWIGGGLAAIFVLPKIVRAAGVSSSAAAGITQEATINLNDISGASWTKPLYLTVERTMNLGAITTLPTLSQQRKNREIGEAINTIFASMNAVYRGVVVPAIIEPGRSKARVIAKITTKKQTQPNVANMGFWDAIWSGITTAATTVSSVAWEGVSAVGSLAWDGAQAVGGLASDLWESTAGIRSTILDGGKTVVNWTTSAVSKISDVVQGSETLQKALIGLGVSVAGSALAKTNTSDVSGQTASSPSGSTPGSVGSSTGPGATDIPTETVLIGYSSSVRFPSPAALEITKTYNSQVKDTALITDSQMLQQAVEIGYQPVEQLGFASPEPFKGCVPLIRLFNPTTIDTIVITNTAAVSKLEAIGYQSHGVIGYIRAAS